MAKTGTVAKTSYFDLLWRITWYGDKKKTMVLWKKVWQCKEIYGTIVNIVNFSNSLLYIYIYIFC